MTKPWRIAMTAKLETDDAKLHFKKRKQTVEPVFGITKCAIGFTCFRLRGLTKAQQKRSRFGSNCEPCALS